MSINDEITTLSTAIDNIKIELRNKGQTVLPTDTVASLKFKIDNLSNKSGDKYSKSPLTDVIEGTIQNLYDKILDYIRPYCFTGCGVFKQAYFLKIKKICPNAFDRCYQFKTIILPGDFVILEDENAFKYTLIEKNKGKIYVKDSLVNTYKTDAKWSVFASQIEPISNWSDTFN